MLVVIENKAEALGNRNQEDEGCVLAYELNGIRQENVTI